MAKHPAKSIPPSGPKCSCRLQSGRRRPPAVHQPACARRLWRERTDALEAVRTLRAYIAAPEGDGPIRYIEALELCDRLLAVAVLSDPGPSKRGPLASAEPLTPEASPNHGC